MFVEKSLLVFFNINWMFFSYKPFIYIFQVFVYIRKKAVYIFMGILTNLYRLQTLLDLNETWSIFEIIDI